MPRAAHEVLDTKTKKQYPSMYAAGKALTNLVPDYKGKPNLIWFSIHRAFPERFKIKNDQGAWIDIPKAVRVKKAKKEAAAPATAQTTGTGAKATAPAKTKAQTRAELEAQLAALDNDGEAADTSTQAAEADAVEEVETVADESEATPVRGGGKKLASAMRTPKGA